LIREADGHGRPSARTRHSQRLAPPSFSRGVPGLVDTLRLSTLWMDEQIKVHVNSPRPSPLPGSGEGVDVALPAHLSISPPCSALMLRTTRGGGRFRRSMNLKTAVERFKIPFAPSPSKGERDFESHPMGERRNVAHSSTSPSRNSFFIDVNHGFSRHEKSFKQLKTAPVSW